jgi:hypothetical protein
VGWVVALIAAISILLTERYPEPLWNFQAGVVRWEARLLAYLASLSSSRIRRSRSTPGRVKRPAGA